MISLDGLGYLWLGRYALGSVALCGRSLAEPGTLRCSIFLYLKGVAQVISYGVICYNNRSMRWSTYRLICRLGYVAMYCSIPYFGDVMRDRGV